MVSVSIYLRDQGAFSWDLRIQTLPPKRPSSDTETSRCQVEKKSITVKHIIYLKSNAVSIAHNAYSNRVKQ